MNTQPPASVQTNIDPDTSRTITALRFLLMVFVVFIHHGTTRFTDADGKECFYDLPLFVEQVVFLITDIVARCAVPLFFFFSAYLAHLKQDTYLTLLKKKFKSILLPFLLWTVLYIIAYSILKALPFLQPFMDNPGENVYFHKSIQEWVEVFIGKFHLAEDNEMPSFVFQFWYLRDLLILFAFLPLLERLLAKLPFAFLALTLLLWRNSTGFHLLVSSEALLCFTLGLFAANKRLSVHSLEKIAWKELCLLLVTTSTAELIFAYFKNFDPDIIHHTILHKFNIVEFSILFLKLGFCWQQNERTFAILKWLSGYSFWLFALHQPLLQPSLVKIWQRFLPKEGYAVFAEYFLTVSLTIVISLVVGVLVKKVTPKFFALLTGGR